MYNPMFDPDLTIQRFAENLLKCCNGYETSRRLDTNRLKMGTNRLGNASRLNWFSDCIWALYIGPNIPI